jgi:hypothetical protein
VSQLVVIVVVSPPPPLVMIISYSHTNIVRHTYIYRKNKLKL